ncbi:MAG: hypothetical protein AAGC65_16430 [Mucilaginibacter sp.]|uniref:hypothetical protein n=1 Tax=Mucilaginibacter sp. TaxID=1882438 RepID=UPI0031A094BF
MNVIIAEFVVWDKFVLSSRKSFCLLGELLSGELCFGNVATEMNICDEYGLSAPIYSVEDARVLDKPDVIGLLIKYEDETELLWLNSLTRKQVLYIKS